MKLCGLSPFRTASKDEILSFLKQSTAELIVLPGVCKNTPTAAEVQGVIHGGVAVFVQEGKSKSNAKSYVVTRDKARPMPSQFFRQSPSAEDMDNLVSAWSKRTFDIGSRKMTFIICGEINGFNPDGGLKHKRVLPPFDILGNPAHTLMGRWQHLGRKLRALSKGRVVIHVANNNRNHGGLSTDVRIYMNEKLQDDKLKQAGRLKWCECEV